MVLHILYTVVLVAGGFVSGIWFAHREQKKLAFTVGNVVQTAAKEVQKSADKLTK